MDIKDQITKMGESIGMRWSTASDLGSVARKIAENNPNAEMMATVCSGTENGEIVTELTFRVKIKGSSLNA